MVMKRKILQEMPGDFTLNQIKWLCKSLDLEIELNNGKAYVVVGFVVIE